MAKVVTPITARVEVVGKLKESAYQAGQYYRSVLFVDLGQPTGSDAAKIWKSLSESECEGLIKGAVVQLVPAGKSPKGEDKHNIVLMDVPPSAVTLPGVSSPPRRSSPVASEGWSPEQKRAIANKVQQHADLMAYCLQTSRTKFEGLVQEEESFRALATTLFLAAIKSNY